MHDTVPRGAARTGTGHVTPPRFLSCPVESELGELRALLLGESCASGFGVGSGTPPAALPCFLQGLYRPSWHGEGAGAVLVLP